MVTVLILALVGYFGIVAALEGEYLYLWLLLLHLPLPLAILCTVLNMLFV